MKKAQQTSDGELVKRCQNGEKDAFAIVIEKYRAPLFTYLYRLSLNKVTAEDLFQDTIFKVWQSIHTCNPDNNIRGWLFRIAYNTVVDYKRKWRKIQFVDNYPDHVDANTPHHLFEKDEERKVLEQALSELTDKQRHVFLLRQHSELSFKDISEMMNEPLNTVLSHMNYAVKKLQKYIRDYYDVKA